MKKELTVWGLKSCDTCRKATRALRAKFDEFEEIDVRADGVLPEDLQRFWDRFGADLVNRRSTTWRGLSEAERETDPVALIRLHPTLMKRPVIEQDGALYLGWSKDVQARLLD